MVIFIFNVPYRNLVLFGVQNRTEDMYIVVLVEFIVDYEYININPLPAAWPLKALFVKKFQTLFINIATFIALRS